MHGPSPHATAHDASAAPADLPLGTVTHREPTPAGAAHVPADAATALAHLLAAISDAIDARESIPPRVGRAYNAAVAAHAGLRR